MPALEAAMDVAVTELAAELAVLMGEIALAAGYKARKGNNIMSTAY